MRIKEKLSDQELLTYLKDNFTYNPHEKCGVFTRRKDSRHYRKNTIAGKINPSNGLWRLVIKSKDYYEHNLVWIWNHHVSPWRKLLRHNRDKLDNRIENLYLPPYVSKSYYDKDIRGKHRRIQDNARKFNHSLTRLANGLFRAHIGDYHKDFSDKQIAQGWHLKTLGELGFNYVL